MAGELMRSPREIEQDAAERPVLFRKMETRGLFFVLCSFATIGAAFGVMASFNTEDAGDSEWKNNVVLPIAVLGLITSFVAIYYKLQTDPSKESQASLKDRQDMIDWHRSDNATPIN